MGRGSDQLAPSAHRRPNKIGAGYAARASRRAFWGREGGGLGIFSGARGGQAAPIGQLAGAGALEGGSRAVQLRIVVFQGLGLGLGGGVEWRPSNGWGQGVDLGAESPRRRLIANLTDAGPVGRRGVAAWGGGPGRAGGGGGGGGGGVPPQRVARARTMVASGGPGIFQNRPSTSLGTGPRAVPACPMLPTGPGTSMAQMGSGVRAARGARNGSALRRAQDRLGLRNPGALRLANGVGGHGVGTPFGRERIRGSYAGEARRVNRR
jgi:hypothetical protein